MTENGRDWQWVIAVVDGLGNVCFQRASGSGPHGTLVRKVTVIIPRETGPGKVDFDFKAHLFHATGVWPEELRIRSSAISVIAIAPKKVVRVLEETWSPVRVKPATPSQVAHIRKLGDKV